MKIVLVVASAKGRNVVFVSDALRAYSLDEAVRLARAGKLDNVYAVNGKSGAYLRTRRSVPKKEELEQLVVSSRQLFSFANDAGSALSHIALNRYLQLHERALKRREDLPFIAIGGIARISKKEAKRQLQLHKKLIFGAAEAFKVDPYLLGAIIIDEISRFTPFEGVLEKLGVLFINKDASGGIAQVKVETARGLIKDGYYNPNPGDSKLSPERVGKVSRTDLYEHVKQPKHSIFFAAARMRALTDKWKKFVDLSAMPEIVATLYSLEYKPPHSKPEANKRGLQISGEFYRLAWKWLR